MGNMLCKTVLRSRFGLSDELSHDGTIGMHWGYRYHQPYSQGYQAQEKGIFLGQLTSKLRKSGSGSGSRIHPIGRDGSTHTTKKSFRETLRDAYGSAKSKFDAWNKIDTSKTMAEVMALQKQAQTELRKSRIYGDKQDVETARLRFEGGKNDVTNNIVSALSSMRETHHARAQKALSRSNELYEKAKIDTKMKMLSHKLGIPEAKVKYGKILSDMCALGSTNVQDVPKVFGNMVSSSRLSKIRRKNAISEMNERAGRNTGEILTKLAGLRKEQGLMPVGQIASMMRQNLGKNRNSADEWKLIRQELSKRQEAGYRDSESSIEKLMHNVWFVSGNEPGRLMGMSNDDVESIRKKVFDY